MPRQWSLLGFNDTRTPVSVPGVVAGEESVTARFERFLAALESDDPAQYRPQSYATAPTPQMEDRSTEPQLHRRRLFVSNFPTVRLFICSLSTELLLLLLLQTVMTENDVAAFFAQYGPVHRLKHLENAVLVEFKTEKAAALLLTQTGKISINGRTLTITPVFKKTTEQRQGEEGEGKHEKAEEEEELVEDTTNQAIYGGEEDEEIDNNDKDDVDGDYDAHSSVSTDSTPPSHSSS